MKIKILGINFKIKKVCRGVLDKGATIGRMNSGSGEIFLRDNLPADIELSTVIHETIHILSVNLGLDLSEEQTTALEAGIMSVIMCKENAKILTELYYHARSVK